jgi:hypothetical protein
MLKKEAPRIAGLTQRLQENVDQYWKLLNSPGNILDSRRLYEEKKRLAAGSITVSELLWRFDDEKFEALKFFFLTKIFSHALYATAIDSQSETLVSDEGGVCVASQKMPCYTRGTVTVPGYIEVTISSGKKDEDNFREIIFISSVNDPTIIVVHDYYGRLEELTELVQKASERFEDVSSALTVMQPEVGAMQPVPDFRNIQSPKHEIQ